MDAKEARRRQKVIQSTLDGLTEILKTNSSLQKEMDPEQEAYMKVLIELAVHKFGVQL